jgi:Fe-S-cluster-containing dehydrogenase component
MVDAEKCSGCRACEAFCSLKHEDLTNPAKARLHIVKWEQRGLYVPMSCRRCEKPACQQVCPVGATYRDYDTGAMRVNHARCIGCQTCISACPFGGSTLDLDDSRVLRCDLCDGDPTCTKVCPTGALRFEPATKETYLKLVDNARHLADLVRTVVVGE